MKWRLLDTGIRSGADNMALDAVLLEGRAAGESPNTVRFLQFEPSVALVGHHQVVDQEISRDYCNERGIEINRRLTGGGAIFFDPSQIGWEVIASQRDVGTFSMTELTARICNAAAAGLRSLGVDACFRPRNDIEVDGRKISGTGGTADGDTFLYQGTVLTDFDIETMLRVLRVPKEKLDKRGLASARERVTCLRELLDPMPDTAVVKAALADAFGAEFGAELQKADLTNWERSRFDDLADSFRSDEWIDSLHAPQDGKRQCVAVHHSDGGLLRVHAMVDVERRLMTQVLIAGDFFVNPQRAVVDLEAALKDTPFDEVDSRVEAFFANADVDLVGLCPDDFAAAVGQALESA